MAMPVEAPLSASAMPPVNALTSCAPAGMEPLEGAAESSVIENVRFRSASTGASFWAVTVTVLVAAVALAVPSLTTKLTVLLEALGASLVFA